MEATVHKEQRFKRSPITQQLVQHLNTLPEGGFTSYKDLNNVAQCDVQFKKRYYLTTACRILTQDHGKVFKADTNRGIVRVANSEIDHHANAVYIGRLKSNSKQYQTVIDCVDTERLDADGWKEHRYAIAMSGMLSMVASPKVHREIKKQTAQQPHEFLSREAMIEKLKRFG